MTEYVLAFKPAVSFFGSHDPSAVIFCDGTPIFGVEEERFVRQKHAEGVFPTRAIEACLDDQRIGLADVDRIVVPYVPKLRSKILSYDLARTLLNDDSSVLRRLNDIVTLGKLQFVRRRYPLFRVRELLDSLDGPVPPIELREHHACHAASAFHPSGFEEALVLTLDGRGEYDSTVVWHGTADGLERLETKTYPNSLGHFYGIITEYLGYRSFNGEGKVMGLAPYGTSNPAIESTLRDVLTVGAEYDVTSVTKRGFEAGVEYLEDLFGRERNQTEGEFDQWEKDLAYATQHILEEIVTDIVTENLSIVSENNVALAGGVALNCKLNKRIIELEETEDVFIQPVAHDGGLALGAGWLSQPPADVEMPSIYLGSSFEMDEIVRLLDQSKISYNRPDDIPRYAATRLSEGALVGWFQGSMEMGPRALGNRSILADPRTAESRDRVNQYVKHREAWRPFAPSMLEEAAEAYLHDAEPSSYMIKTFDTKAETRSEIQAVIHPADSTTRPQTVREDQNPRYYRLISEFADITGVPVVLNTSFNDHAEPIVRTPTEAIKDFYGTGLDTLVIGDCIVEK